MKKTHLFPFLACFGLAFTVNAQILFDDFDNGTINSALWNTMTTGPDSSITTSLGNGVFRNRGRLTSIQSFVGSEITGRLKFTDSPSDSFKIILRTDGALQNNQYQEAANGIMVEITSSSNWDSDASRNVRIVNIVNGTETIQGGLVLNMNTFYDFRIVDSGTSVSAYVGSQALPLLTLQTSASFGQKISFYNREEIGSINHVTQVDYISIVPEPSSLAICGISGFLLLAVRIKTRGHCS